MRYIIYGHGGSRNHGCEAIIRTTLALLGEGNDIDVYSSDVDGDRKYGAAELAKFHPYGDTKSSIMAHINWSANVRLFKNYDPMTKLEFKDILDEKDQIFISIGGDNYCNGHPGKHVSRNKIFSKNNKTVLWGCSVTPSLFKERYMVDDMNRYSLITPRESLTYQAIVDAGVKTKTVLVPDPAFTLPLQETELPEGFVPGNTVGVNLSPMVISYEKESNILFDSACRMIEDIIKSSDMNVALIPHVIWKSSDDLIPLRMLHEKYMDTGRVCLVDPDSTLNCMELKYIISKCRFMVTARTHASIASYSTCVPTLVLGYSIKSKGIATDLFGTADGFVLPVDTVSDADALRDAFGWLKENEADVRTRLHEFMPSYIEKAYLPSELIREV